MAEWLRRQIRTPFDICFPLGAQVQILLVSIFLKLARLDYLRFSTVRVRDHDIPRYTQIEA